MRSDFIMAVTPSTYARHVAAHVKTRTLYRCQACGNAAAKWAGKCSACDAWNTLHEEIDRGTGAGAGVRNSHRALVPTEAAQPIHEVDASHVRPESTGIAEVDLVLGGGLVPGSVTLLGGEPGIGKSTLLLQLLAVGTLSGSSSCTKALFQLYHISLVVTMLTLVIMLAVHYCQVGVLHLLTELSRVILNSSNSSEAAVLIVLKELLNGFSARSWV